MGEQVVHPTVFFYDDIDNVGLARGHNPFLSRKYITDRFGGSSDAYGSGHTLELG